MSSSPQQPATRGERPGTGSLRAPHKPRPTALLAAAVAAVALASCSGDDGGATAGAGNADGRAQQAAGGGEQPAPLEETVRFTEDGIRPVDARIRVGGTVTWINKDPTEDHTAETAKGKYTDLVNGEDQSFDTHTLSWNEPYSVTFHTPGTYKYHCAYHFGEEGTVEVVEPEPPGS